MADLTGGHLVARTLKQAGVGHVFTLCGGHILPIYDGCLTEGIQVVDMRHEQAGAHAADAYARLTRNVGVAIVTAGPGRHRRGHRRGQRVLRAEPAAPDRRRGAARPARAGRAAGDGAGRRCCGPSPRARGRWRRRARSPRC